MCQPFWTIAFLSCCVRNRRYAIGRALSLTVCFVTDNPQIPHAIVLSWLKVCPSLHARTTDEYTPGNNKKHTMQGEILVRYQWNRFYHPKTTVHVCYNSSNFSYMYTTNVRFDFVVYCV